MSENVTTGAKNWQKFRCFLLGVTRFFYFSKIWTCVLQLTLWWKKDKKEKSTASYNITPDFEKFHFYKNRNIIRNSSNKAHPSQKHWTASWNSWHRVKFDRVTYWCHNRQSNYDSKVQILPNVSHQTVHVHCSSILHWWRHMTGNMHKHKLELLSKHTTYQGRLSISNGLWGRSYVWCMALQWRIIVDYNT